jgi:general secretion pathway protein H
MRRAARGFTLIEIMVVVIIIGVIAGTVMLSLRIGGTSQLQEETEHFILSARFVSDQATLNREIIGLFVEPGGGASGAIGQWCYEWQRFLDQNWQPASDYLDRHCLPEGLDLELLVEGEPYQYDPRATTPTPVLVFYPSGEATPFELAIAPSGFGSGEEIQRVEVDMTGRIRWRNDEEARERYEQTQW